jgi:F-type H+-transporting ATPase subunit c
MDTVSLSFGLTYSIAALGAAIGLGLVGAAALNAIGRNPDATGIIRTTMILAMSFVDALAIIGLVVALIIKFVR